jgi:hypothetical protein
MEVRMKRKSLYAAFGAAAIALTAVQPALAEGWVKDAVTGCQVWSAETDAGKETVTWSGACVDNKASGAGILVVMQKTGLAGIYDGEMKAGRLHGEGEIIIKNDETGGFDTYTGDFAKGTLDGEGELVSSKGWSYSGQFKDGEEHGSGTVENDDGSVFKSNFKAGKPVGVAMVYYKTKDGETYLGEAENKERNGQGHLIHANGDVYIGEFEDGKASGAGTYDAAEGGVYIGTFENGKPNGFGSYQAPNGDVYQGRFVNSKPEGKILVTGKDNKQSVETWENGEKKG